MTPGFKGMMVQGNGYTFHCPVVDRDARALVCGFKKAKHWRGEDFKEHDCKCAMNASKCPIIHMLNKENRLEETLYFDAESTNHNLPRDILHRIEHLMICGGHTHNLDLDPAQRERLLTGDLRIVRVKGEIEEPDEEEEAPVRAKRTRQKKPQNDMAAGLEAATTDMSDVINDAVAAE